MLTVCVCVAFVIIGVQRRVFPNETANPKPTNFSPVYLKDATLHFLMLSTTLAMA